ncbi:MAG: undecaprenyl-diphosphatase UppP [Ignavibacteriae bacterium]|nr:MAG: undecaprenyl-diphosphatase UppP [Ignavibacteriota bacterium]
MSTLVAAILGLVQGLSEFIPISSTAHLTLAAAAFGVIDPVHPERWTAFMATIQLGTLAAVIVYFRRDILNVTTAFVRENLGAGRRRIAEQSADARMGWLVAIGTTPIVIVGLLFKDVIEGSFTKELNVIGASLIILAVVLWWAERVAPFKKSTSDMTMGDALAIGLAQCLALIPGSSRSGTTIMAGLFRGLTREHAARYSFVMSIPAILGAGVLEFASELDHISWSEGGMQLVIATVVSAISGYWSIAFLLKFLKTRSLFPFIAYRIALGAVILFTGCSPESKQDEPAPIAKEMTPPAETIRTLPASAGQSDTAVVTDIVTVKTSMGQFTIGLYGQDAPLTVRNFLGLVGRKYYDGVLVHRVSKDFVIQLGDPKTRDAGARAEWGRGGETASGEPLPEELDMATPSARRGYQAGVVAMARKPASGTGTSQIFICLKNASSLPFQYTIFGAVIDGMDVVEKIGSADVEPGPLGESDGIPRRPITVRAIKKTITHH